MKIIYKCMWSYIPLAIISTVLACCDESVVNYVTAGNIKAINWCKIIMLTYWESAQCSLHQ